MFISNNLTWEFQIVLPFPKTKYPFGISKQLGFSKQFKNKIFGSNLSLTNSKMSTDDVRINIGIYFPAIKVSSILCHFQNPFLNIFILKFISKYPFLMLVTNLKSPRILKISYIQSKFICKQLSHFFGNFNSNFWF